MPYAVWDGALANMNVIIPDEDTAKRFNGVVKNLIEKIQNNSANNFRLRSLRDAILPKLMSGELSLIS
jgi:type I restriction enzyme S subunit